MEWRDFPNLTSAQQLQKYIAGREMKHTDYCHYTRADSGNRILENKQIWIGCVAKFNDEKDKEQYAEELQRYIFSLCFSTGVNENLALWYLYSGMDGKGVRFRWKRGEIKEFCRSTFELIRLDGNKREVERIPLKDGENMKLTFRDVMYYQDGENGSCSLKYNTMTNYKMSQSEFEEYKSRNRGFYKGIIWFYEKETRLQVELLGNAKELVDQFPEAQFKVALKIPEKVLKKTKIDFAPEVTDILKATEQLSALRTFLTNTSSVQLSKYHGTVAMKLCDKCAKRCETMNCANRQKGN